MYYQAMKTSHITSTETEFKMEDWNKTQLIINHMSSLGCFDHQNADSPICKRLLELLIPKNEAHAEVKDYLVVNPVVTAIYSLSIFLNCALLWMMYKDPLKKFRTVSSLLIANLTVSDLLGACLSLIVESEISSEPKQNPRLSSTVSSLLYMHELHNKLRVHKQKCNLYGIFDDI